MKIGDRVALTISGEEHGWDDDRGRPEAIDPDRKVIGRLSGIYAPMPNGNRQVVVSFEDENGDIRDVWGWIGNVEAVK